MAKKKAKASSLSFKLIGAVSPGCQYAVIKWKPGSSKRRTLVSCHRDRSVAKHAAKKFGKQDDWMQKVSKTLRGFGIGSAYRVAVFDLMTGKKVK